MSKDIKINWIDKPLARYVPIQRLYYSIYSDQHRPKEVFPHGQLFFIIKKYNKLAYVCAIQDVNMFWHVPIEDLDFQER